MKKTTKLVIHLVLIILSCVMVFPFLWMVSSSLKLERDVFEFPIRIIPRDITFENYRSIFNSEEFNFIRYFLNTIYISVTVTLIQVSFSSMAAYAFAKLKFPGRDKIFIVYLSNLMIPFQATIIPLYFIMLHLKWIDTHASLISISAFSAFGVFLLRQFYMTIPMELSEAAKLDGCGNFGIYSRVMLPIMKPALATLVMFTFLWKWNDFQAPYVFLSSPSKFTIVLGLKSFVDVYNIEYGKIMAGSSVAMLPIIFLYYALQKNFVQGIATTGVKG